MIKTTSNLASVSTFELGSLSNQGWAGKLKSNFFFIILHTSVHWLSSIGNLCVGEKALNVFFSFRAPHHVHSLARLAKLCNKVPKLIKCIT